jgi:mono/diheme cytochrome c family protein
MYKYGAVSILSAALICGGFIYREAPVVSAQATPQPESASPQRALINQYCVTCHNPRTKAGGLTLDTANLSNIGSDGQIWEKVVRKLRGGVMPPSGARRPDQATINGFISWLQASLDRDATAHPNPGRTEPFHRLNRAEYKNAVRDLLDVDVDVAALLPLDDANFGFDNVPGGLQVSPTLLEKYLSAAKKISRLAVGTPPPVPSFDVIRVPDDAEQDHYVEGLPFGTRGGAVIRYNFPADGEYVVRVKLARQTNAADQDVARYDVPQSLEISLDGERLTVFTLAASAGVDAELNDTPPRRRATESLPQPPRPQLPREGRSTVDADWQVRFQAKAGPRTIAAAFLNSTSALSQSLIEPYARPLPLGSNTWSPRKGAYLQEIAIAGPFAPRAATDTPSRLRLFVCHPARASEELACARRILSNVARRAFRRPITDADLSGIMAFYEEGWKESGFESGIEFAIRSILVTPEFLFRIERDPTNAAPNTNYRISNLELASRLSFFLWSSIPDDELLDVATNAQLNQPATLEKQVRRMLADRKSKALVENFVGQWLLLRNVPALGSDVDKDPDFDEDLRHAMRRETELLVDSVIHEDRPILDLIDADYTFLNERLADHYGIGGVSGVLFRRVSLPAGSVRGGLLGQASILSVTSHGDRTSPVLRGKWIMENLLGTPPPAPPANVPPLPDRKGTKTMTMREQMAEHRANPVCASCHRMMDGLGLALENFDQAGRWRAVDQGADSRNAVFAPIDATGNFPDGEPFDGVLGVRAGVLKRADLFYSTFIEKLLTYAVGRGLEYYDMPAIRAIGRDAETKQYRFSAIVLGIVNSLPFQQRRSQS